MSLVVQKFGGTSVADPEKILSAARKSIRALRDGNQVVVVVSAMGKNTDHLIDLAGQIGEDPPAREMDMLLSTGEQVSVALMAMAVHSLGHKAVSLTGAQMGIQTDSSFTRARIRKISPERIKRLLADGNIVIAAGFQGIDEDLNITTLGRGGSDTTAVALAAVLHADACEIHTDVDGVYTTDPRQLPEARQMSRICYDEMLELASLGAGVMHNRSIEFAKKYGVPIHVRSSFSDTQGTLITSESEADSAAVCGAAMTRDEVRFTIQGVPDKPGSSYGLFKHLADNKITVDMIVQNVAENGKADISFTVPKDEFSIATETVKQAVEQIGASGWTLDQEVSKISAVGLGMADQTGVAQQMFRALSLADINIQMITTSEIKISVLVAKNQALAALRAVHSSFRLDETPPNASTWDKLPSRQSNDADLQKLVDDLHAADMEQLSLNDISLADDQARMTLSGVPDRPGLAAEVFDAIAAEGIFVDMIVQSYDGFEGETSLSFTVLRTQYEVCLASVKRLSEAYGLRQVSGSKEIAKLSVSGIGLRSHTSVAIGMFEVLAEGGINVEMINTSELRVNVVVDGAKGGQGLKCLQRRFAERLS